MADGGSFVSSRPSVSINGATIDAFGQNLLEAIVRAPFEAMMSAELRVVNWGPPTSGGEPALASNPFNLRADRGLANFDARNAGVVNASYALPFGSGRHFLNTASGIGSVLLSGY